MASKAQGKLVVLVWSDNGVVKPVVLDTGAIPVTETDPLTQLDVNLKSSDITLDVTESSPLTQLDVNLKSSDITLGVTESSPLQWINAKNYSLWGGAWRIQPIMWGFSDRWAEYRTGVSTGGAATNAISISVPAGYVYKVELVNIEHNDTVARSVFVVLVGNGINIRLYTNSALAPNTTTLIEVNFTLKTGDYIQFTVWGLADTKTAYLTLWGVKMVIS